MSQEGDKPRLGALRRIAAGLLLAFFTDKNLKEQINSLRWMQATWVYVCLWVLLGLSFVASCYLHSAAAFESALAVLLFVSFFPPLKRSWNPPKSVEPSEKYPHGVHSGPGLRAGWPVLLIPSACAVFAFWIDPTGQGVEALRSVSQWHDGWRIWGALLAIGVLLRDRFLHAVNWEYWPGASTEQMTARDDGKSVANGVAVAVPLVCAITLAHDFFSSFAGWNTAYEDIVTLRPGAAIGFAGCALCILALIAAKPGSWLPRTFVSLFFLVTVFACGAAWWSPGLAAYMGPVVVLALGINIWTGWTVTFSRFGLASWTAFAAVWFAVFAALNAFDVHRYQIQAVSCPQAEAGGNCNRMQSRETALDHAGKWLSAHARQAGAGKPVRAVIVLAEGGGIRAALETASVLAHLDRGTNDAFYDRIFAMSGVSGGALGLASYVAAHASRTSPQTMVDQLQAYLEEDHLSPLLIGLLWGDMQSPVFPLYAIGAEARSWNPDWKYLDRDRALVLEDSLEERWTGSGQAMSLPLADALQRSVGRGEVPPIAVLNTTNANDGTLEVVSNVEFRSPSDGQPHVASLEPCNVLDRLPESRTLTLAGAAILSARFPLVTPPGLVEMEHDACGDTKGAKVYFVDGGYLDNSGALGAQAALSALEQAARKLGVPAQVTIIRIFARDPAGSGDRFGDRLASDADWRVPIQGLMAARDTLGLTPVETLCAQAVRVWDLSPQSATEDGAKPDTAAPAFCGAVVSAGESAPAQILIHRDSDVTWIDAKLEYSSRPNDPRYVPLGWLLGPSKTYVERSACAIASGILVDWKSAAKPACP